MSITRSLLWFGEQVIPAEARVPKTKFLDASEDAHGRVIIDMKEPMDSDVFASVLRTSISHWRQQGKKGIWIKLPIELVNLVEAAVKEGFTYHHAEPSYLMLVNASNQVVFGAFVTNSKQEVLVVQENSTGVWKLPTGVVDEGEEICIAAMREVREETGIETEFSEVLAFGQSHNSGFGVDCVFILKPLSFDIQTQNSEFAAAKWMPREEFAAQPFIQKHEQFGYIAKACLEKDDNYTGFSAVPTTTGFPSKKNYLYINKKDLSCENCYMVKL